jgi:maltose alpha-D-glucosyltransferase/alpha-amylase
MAQDEPPPQIATAMSHFLESVRLIGMRTAELHSALASDSQLTDFAPEPFSVLYQRGIYQTMRTTLLRTFESLRKRIQDIPEEVCLLSKLILESQDKILKSYREIIGLKIHATRIRCNGDYHLGQLLYTGKDFVIINFEGDVSKTFSERKIKVSPLSDVVSMICSFRSASSMALKRHLERSSATHENTSLLKSWAKVWQRWSASVFLKSYLQTCSHMSFIPQQQDELNLLLKVFSYNRAVCLLQQELSQNIKGVEVPLEMIEELLEITK